MSRGTDVRLLVPLLVVHLLLSLAFVRATPVLEASDESRHFGYVIEWKQSGALPTATREDPGFAAQEAFQPPLYYALVRLAALGTSFDDADNHYRERPDSPIGRADLPGPRNMLEPVPPRRSPPGTGIAVLRGRSVSVLLSAMTVGVTWLCAVAIGVPVGVRLFAACLVAFNPMFLFIGSSVNNDALVALLTSIGLLACLRCMDRPLTLTAAAGLGLLAGLATLAKLSGLILLPAIAVVLVTRVRDARSLARRWLATLAGFMAVTGWWFLWRAMRTGSPLPDVAAHAEVLGNGRATFQPLALAREWDGFFKSFWGVFGAFNIIYPNWVYFLMLLATLTLGAASVLRAMREPSSRIGVLFTLVLANLAAVAFLTASLTASQGRLMFPSIAAIAVLSGWGLARLPRRVAAFAGATIAAGLLASSTYAALVLIPGSYLWP